MKIGRRPMPQRPAGERNKDFSEVNLGLSAEEAVEEAQRCLDCAKPGCLAGCPVRIDIPSFVKLVEKGRIRRGRGEDPGGQQPAGHLRPRLPAGIAVRRELPPEEGLGRRRGHRQPRALRLRRRAPQGRRRCPQAPPADGPQGRRRRGRTGRTDRGRRDGPGRARRDGLRGPPRRGRCPRLRHSRIPPAQEHPRRRGRLPRASRRRVPHELHRRQDRDHRRSAGRRLRGLLHRDRCGPAQLS